SRAAAHIGPHPFRQPSFIERRTDERGYSGGRGLTAKLRTRQRPRSPAARWRSGYAEDCKSLHAGSIPARASKILTKTNISQRLTPVVIQSQGGPERALLQSRSCRWRNFFGACFRYREIICRRDAHPKSRLSLLQRCDRKLNRGWRDLTPHPQFPDRIRFAEENCEHRSVQCACCLGQTDDFGPALQAKPRQDVVLVFIRPKITRSRASAFQLIPLQNCKRLTALRNDLRIRINQLLGSDPTWLTQRGAPLSWGNASWCRDKFREC